MQTPGRTGLYIAAANIYIEWVLVLYQINCKNLQENKLVYRMTMPPSKPKTTKMVPLYKMVVSSKNATSIYETSFTMCCRLSPSNPTFLFILLPSSQPFSSVFIRFPSFSHSIQQNAIANREGFLRVSQFDFAALFFIYFINEKPKNIIETA